jgi:hypothetical protein
MKTVTVPVVKAFEHEGRAVYPGDEIQVAPVVAWVLSRQGLVSIVAGYKVAAAVQPPTPRRRGRAAGSYRRRDLSAEST